MRQDILKVEGTSGAAKEEEENKKADEVNTAAHETKDKETAPTE